jgi:hypothetical protein
MRVDIPTLRIAVGSNLRAYVSAFVQLVRSIKSIYNTKHLTLDITPMSVELNPEIDHLLEAAMGEFRERYGCKINKSDLREMALVYGLMNLDDGVFEIAEEWGLQYNG